MKKTREMRLKFCKGDAVVIVFVIVLAILTGVIFWIRMGTDDVWNFKVYDSELKEIP